MNTLVGLGALSSFAVSSLAAFIPKLVICYSILLHRFLNRNEWIYWKGHIVLFETHNFILIVLN